MSASQIQSKFIADDAITQAKLANSAVGTAEIAADAVTETKIRLSNNAFIRARNAADSADIDILKVNASNIIEFNSFPRKSGTPTNNDELVNKSYVDGLSQVDNWEKETKVLIAGDITAQYVDLGFVAAVDSVSLLVRGMGEVLEGASYEYTLSYTGGAGGVTRLTFANDLATGGASALVATDVLQIRYVRA